MQAKPKYFGCNEHNCCEANRLILAQAPIVLNISL